MTRFPWYRGFALSACLSVVFILPSRADDPKDQPAKVTPAEALKKLKDGNERFIADKVEAKKYAKVRAETAAGQKPFAIVLACADSRVAPELVFDQTLGDIFVVRLAGNAAPPAIIGSIEYAVLHFGTPLIVVLGHDHCGAVSAVVKGEKAEGNIAEAVKLIHTGELTGKDTNEKVANAVRANARFQAEALLKDSKVIAEMVKGERVQIVTGVYNLSSGGIEWLAPPEVKKGK
jgi:carbonic anhydrase